MTSLVMESIFNPQSNHGIMDEQLVVVEDFHHHHHHHDHHHRHRHRHDNISNSCSSSSSINGEEDEEEEEEEVNSSSSSTSLSSSSPLQDMSSLLLQLPLKRGLSKHYNGKSQSFTSLSNVKCLEDLAKKENPFNKKLKTCKSYGGFPRKKPSNKRFHFSSHFNGRRNSSFLGIDNIYDNNNNQNNNSRPPMPPPLRSTSNSSLIY